MADQLDIYDQAIDQLDDTPEASPDVSSVPEPEPAPAPAVDIYDQAIGLLEADEQDATKQSILDNGKRDIDPVRQAEALRISREQGIPVEAVYDDIERFRPKPTPDVEKILSDAPAASRLLADPAKGPALFPDYEKLTDVERALRKFSAEIAQPPEDNSTALGDVKAGIKGAQQIIPGLQAASGTLDLAAGEYGQAQADAWKTELDTIDAELARIEATPGFRSRPKSQEEADNRPILEKRFAELSARRGQLMLGAGAGGTGAMTADAQRKIKEGAASLVEALPEIARLGNEAAAIPINPAAEKFLNPEGDGYADKFAYMWNALASDPTGVVRTAVLRSLPASSPQILATVVGSIGGPAGAASLSALVGGSTEMGASVAQYVTEELKAENIDINDRPAVEQWVLGNTDKMLDIVAKSAKRASVITAGGALSGGVTGKLAEGFAGSSFWSKVGSAFAGMGAEATIDSGAEALAGYVADGEVNLGDVGGELIGGLGQGLVTTTGQIGVESYKAKVAEQRAVKSRDLLTQIGEALNGTAASQHAPELLREFIADLKKEGAAPEQVTAPVEAVEALFQEVDPETQTQVYSEFLATVQEAKAAGTDVTIPTEVLADFSKLKGYKTFTDSVSYTFVGVDGSSVDVPSVNEAFKAREDIDRVLSEMDTEAPAATGRQSPIFTNIRDQLVKAGQSQEAAGFQATVMTSAFETAAARARAAGKNVDPVEFFNGMGVQISSSELTGEKTPGTTVLDQSVQTADVQIDPETPVPVVNVQGAPAEAVDWRAEGDWVKNNLQGQEFVSSDGKPVRVSRQTLKMTSSNTGDPRKALVLRHLPEVIKNAVVYNTGQPDTKGRGNLSYTHAASVVNIQGVDYAVALQYRVSGEGDRVAYQLTGYDIAPPGGDRLGKPAPASGQSAPGSATPGSVLLGTSEPTSGQPVPGQKYNVNQIVSAFKAAPLPLFQKVEGGAPFDPDEPNIFLQSVPSSPEEQEAVDTASLDASNTLSKSQVWQKGRDLKIEMQSRVRGALKKLGIDPSVRSPEAIKYLVNVGVKDALAALAQNPNAIGWYDVKTRQALAVMSLVHPEIMTEPNARFAFTWALAVTSNGIKVGKNFELADAVYRRYKSDGRMPTDIQAGQAQKAINESLGLFNELQARWGTDALRQFMLTDFKVSEISGIDKELTPSGEFSDTMVRGAAILGPKIGNGFFSNLYGVFDALTMDRWLVRTWGRWTGTLIQINDEQVSGARDVLRSMAEKVDAVELAKQLRAVKKRTKTKGETEVKPADRERLIAALEAGWDTDQKVDDLAAAVQKASQEPNFRGVMNAVAGGSELRTKGNNLAKYLDGQKEQPAGPAERNYIREVFQGILDELKAGNETYSGLTMADLQAVLWYAEKRLYETAKEDSVVADEVADGAVSGYEDEEAPDYANAAAAQARADGVPDETIKATLNKEAGNGRSTAARSGNVGEAGSADQAVSGGEGGQQAAARGFTRAEKRNFIQRAAVHRVRSNRTGDAQSSWSYAGEGGKDGGRPRLLKDLGVRYVEIWKPGQKLRTVFKANGINTPAIYELETGSAQNAARFVSAINGAKATLGAVGEAVKVYTPEEYADMRLFLTKDGLGGFALKPDGDIISVFSSKGEGNGRAIMETAIAAGGKKLDAFHTILPEFFSVHGFRGTSRLLWNDEIAMADMPNWDKAALADFNNGEPDVVFMVYDPAYMAGYDRNATPLFEGDNSYDEAVQAQTDAVAAVPTTTTLYQGGAAPANARGFITYNQALTTHHITLTGKANLSTFLHESGHLFLNMLQKLVDQGLASEQQIADLEKIRNWMGLKPGEKIEVKHHELMARGFEAYLMGGKAPSLELQGAFQRFKSWLVFVYRSLAGLNVKLTDEVRGVMDRLLASDQAIQEARAQVGWRGQPMSQEATGLTDAEYKAYTEAWIKANDAQSQDADARVMLEAARELKKVWRDEKIAMTKAAEAELAKTRGYRAWKLLESGEGLEDVRPGWSDIKIDPASIPSEWRRDATGMTAAAFEGGLPLDDVAEILGFRSGEEMLSVIAGARAAQRAIPAKVRGQMEAKHGKMDANALALEASKAVHNKPTMDVLLTEFRAMATKARQNTPKNISRILAAQAEEKVAQLTQRQLEPAKWRRAELKAATEAGAAAARGDANAAFLAKRRQMVAAHMHKATLDAQDRIEKIRDYLATFQTDRRRTKLGKAGDLYLDGVDQILEAIELKDVSLKVLKKRPLLQEIVERAIAEDEPINIPPEVLGLGKKNYSQLTLGELEAVHDAVKNLWTLAKLKNELKTRQGKIAMDKAMDQIEQTAKDYLGTVRQPDNLNPTAIDKAINLLRWGRANLVKMEFLFGWLDGKPDGGLAHQLIYQPIADARSAEYKLMKDLTHRILNPIRGMPREQRLRWDTKRQFMGQTMKGANIIAVALNLGNEQNKAKLLQGYNWNEQQLMAELNQYMTRADWDMVQRIWDAIESLWPHIERVSKNATGLAPPRVVPASVQTPFGEYSGGYYPIVYDPFRTQRMAEKQEADASKHLFTNNFLRPTLANGFTKKRTGYVAPIYLSLDVLSQHLAETVHYVTHYEAVKQADKIRSHPKFQALVTETMGREFWNEIRPWLQDIANNVTQRRYRDFGESFWRRLRIGTSVASMGFNIGTGIQQLFGITTSLDAIGPRYWASGVRKAWLSPKARSNWRFALKESQELEPLIRDWDREVSQLNETYTTSLGKNAVASVAQAAFWHIGRLQLVVNVATWHGAYEQAIAKGRAHVDAVIHADSVVRKTQSANAIKDLADVQRSGEGTKLLTMFYSYFSVLYNRLEDIAKETKSVKDVPRAAMRVALLSVVPAMLNIAYKSGYAALTAGDEEEDEDAPGLTTRIGLESMNQLIGTVPILRNLISFGEFGGTNVPAFNKIEQMGRTATALKDWAVEGETPTRNEIRTTVNVISTLTQTPIYPIYKQLDDLFGEKISDALE